MCRSIRTLRPPYAEQVTDADVHAAALQYVRKVSGFSRPAAHNAAAFDAAVGAVEQATVELLATLRVGRRYDSRSRSDTLRAATSTGSHTGENGGA